MAPPVITFRPHHFLCALGFEGKGYSDGFTANMSQIVVDVLRAPGGDATLIAVTGATDDICGPCPKRRGTLCTEQEKIATLDSRHARALGLFADSRLSWGEAKRRIVKRVPPGSLATLCKGCRWLEMGMCESALARLHETAKAEAPDEDA